MQGRIARHAVSLVLAAGLVAFASSAAVAQKQYDVGASDTEIKIGNIVPYSGPASAYGIIGKMLTAYFKMINDNGGINGRKINFISYDDAYSPPKTVEQARKLVESDEVLLLFAPIGTAGNAAIQKYMNHQKIPQLLVISGASRWGDYEHFPWTMSWQPNYRSEARVYATYIKATYPGKTIGVLYQNDDLGKDYISGMKDVLGSDYTKFVVSEVPFDIAVPTVESQVVAIKSANPDIFLTFSTSKFAAQAIKKIAELNWHPVQFVSNISASVGTTLRPAGLENAKGLLSASYIKDVADPQWDNDQAIKTFRAFLDKYLPGADKADGVIFAGYGTALGITQVLKQSGDNLTRENIMKQAASLDLELDVYLPGLRIKTSPTDFYPIEQLRMMKFNGEAWEFFGDLIDSHTEK